MTAAGNHGEEGESLFKPGHFQVAHVLHSRLDVSEGPADTLDALFHEPCYRRVVFGAERKGGFDLALVHIVFYIVDEILVDLVGLADHPYLFAENIDGDDGKDEEYDHEPTTLGGHVDKGIGHFLGGHCGRLQSVGLK